MPGSGKTTKARALLEADETYDMKHFENDQFHIVKGKYMYSSSMAKYAYALCKSQTAMWLNRGNDVVVANTFITSGSLIDYAAIALETSASVEIFEMNEPYESIHGIPEESIEFMRCKWEGSEAKTLIFDSVKDFTYTYVKAGQDN